jgi:hypothetical protein
LLEHAASNSSATSSDARVSHSRAPAKTGFDGLTGDTLASLSQRAPTPEERILPEVLALLAKIRDTGTLEFASFPVCPEARGVNQKSTHLPRARRSNLIRETGADHHRIRMR